MKRVLMALYFFMILYSYVFGGYPKAENNYINDFANIIDEEYRIKINEKLKDAEREKNKEITVVTVNSINEYGTGASTVEEFAKGLFNKWEVGNTDKNDGVLILISVNDRACYIALGKGYGTDYDGAMKNIINETMIPKFKEGSYQNGIFWGVVEVISESNKGVMARGYKTAYGYMSKESSKYFFWFVGVYIVLAIISMITGRGNGMGIFYIFEIIGYIFGGRYNRYDRYGRYDRYDRYSDYGMGSVFRGGSSWNGSSNSFGGGSSNGGGAGGKW